MSDEAITPRKRSWLTMKRTHDQEEEQQREHDRENVVELVAPQAPPTIIELATEYSGAHDALKEIEYLYQAALLRFKKAETAFDAMWTQKESDADAHNSFLLRQIHEVELAKAERLARRKAFAEGSATSDLG